MKTIMMARTQQDTSFSFSRRYFFNWKKKSEDENDEIFLTSFNSSSHSFSSLPPQETHQEEFEEIKSCVLLPKKTKKNKNKLSVTKFTSIFTKCRSGNVYSTLGSNVVGTLFGYRHENIHIAFQEDSKTTPAFLIELSTLTSVLVREMASGLVRIALECDKNWEKKGVKLLEEPLWRAYCNGKKCGYAIKRECGSHEWQVLRSVGPITMGAGVLPGGGDDGGGGEDDERDLMYMRAKFERIIGSKDSEVFYMMNPNGNRGPELSVYLLRV